MYAASLLLIYLAPSGSLFATYAFTRGSNDKPGDMLGFASLSLIAGLLINLSLVLIFRSVLIAFALGTLLSLGGFIYLFWQRDRLTLTPLAHVQTRASKYLRASPCWSAFCSRELCSFGLFISRLWDGTPVRFGSSTPR